MPRRLTLTPHLSVDELEQRYRGCRTPVERSHWHLLRLVAQGHGVPEAAALVGDRADWARTLIHRYTADGPAGLVDRRQRNRGRTPLLSPALRETLRQALARPAPDGGLWTGRKVAGWMAAQLGRPVGEVRGWEAMVALGFTPQRPRPRATTADPAAQTAFKKGGLQHAVDAVAASHPEALLSVWAEDEHRLGLLPVLRRVWAPRDQRPVAHVWRRYEWLYVYAFVRPTTGESWWCLLPTVSTAAMTLALATFAAECGIDARHRAVLVLDGAGWHTSATLEIPEGLHLVVLPPASPELQPVERVWMLVDEPVANRSFTDLDALEEVLVARCQTLRADRRTIAAHTRFRWWPRERRPRKTA